MKEVCVLGNVSCFPISEVLRSVWFLALSLQENSHISGQNRCRVWKPWSVPLFLPLIPLLRPGCWDVSAPAAAALLLPLKGPEADSIQHCRERWGDLCRWSADGSSGNKLFSVIISLASCALQEFLQLCVCPWRTYRCCCVQEVAQGW